MAKKQDFIHARLSRAYLALARLSCYPTILMVTLMLQSCVHLQSSVQNFRTRVKLTLIWDQVIV